MRVDVGRPVRGATNPRNVVEVAVPEQGSRSWTLDVVNPKCRNRGVTWPSGGAGLELECKEEGVNISKIPSRKERSWNMKGIWRGVRSLMRDGDQGVNCCRSATLWTRCAPLGTACGEGKSARLVEQPHPKPEHWYIKEIMSISDEGPPVCSPSEEYAPVRLVAVVTEGLMSPTEVRAKCGGPQSTQPTSPQDSALEWQPVELGLCSEIWSREGSDLSLVITGFPLLHSEEKTWEGGIQIGDSHTGTASLWIRVELCVRFRERTLSHGGSAIRSLGSGLVSMVGGENRSWQLMEPSEEKADTGWTRVKDWCSLPSLCASRVVVVTFGGTWGLRPKWGQPGVEGQWVWTLRLWTPWELAGRRRVGVCLPGPDSVVSVCPLVF
ncbi:hypothetical protein Cadr_000012345 [Camelus dromedarius]|uniref:Uncharacterized protein n=1 Tax=Camelus dromedarius TaxID=9838 RepID=A0A5N4DUN7_CAMDR|nr:hypothetical protein Cadr_000012345 [Camelus dromedarius]